MTDLFLSICLFLFDMRLYYKNNISASVYVEQTFMFNVICNVYYYKKKKKKTKKKKTSECSCLLSVYQALSDIY